ncbi:MAG: helix-turn-helix domain-containing protein [Pirellulales bacterium]
MADFQINGDKLRSFRRACGWTQLELAIIAGVSERTVRNAERSRPLRRDFVDFLATALDVEAEDLVSDPAALRPARRCERLVHRVVTALHDLNSELTARTCMDVTQPGCELSHQASISFPFVGSFRGADGLRRYFDLVLPWLRSSIDYQISIDAMRASGNLVIIQGIDSWVSADDGSRQFARFVQIHQFERERIRSFEGYSFACDPPPCCDPAK